HGCDFRFKPLTLLFRDRCLEPLAGALRRPWPRGRECQQGQVAAQRFKLAAAFLARSQMRLQFRTRIVLECAHGVERQVFRELCVVRHENAFLNASNAERMRVFTVPSGSPVLPAISVCVMPSKKAISRAWRCSWGSPASTPRIFSTASRCA